MNNILQVNDSFEEIGTRTIDERNRLTVGEILKGSKRIRLYRNDRGEVLLQPIAEIPASELGGNQRRPGGFAGGLAGEGLPIGSRRTEGALIV
jgi:hypothetical protein